MGWYVWNFINKSSLIRKSSQTFPEPTRISQKIENESTTFFARLFTAYLNRQLFDCLKKLENVGVFHKISQSFAGFIKFVVFQAKFDDKLSKCLEMSCIVMKLHEMSQNASILSVNVFLPTSQLPLVYRSLKLTGEYW